MSVRTTLAAALVAVGAGDQRAVLQAVLARREGDTSISGGVAVEGVGIRERSGWCRTVHPQELDARQSAGLRAKPGVLAVTEAVH